MPEYPDIELYRGFLTSRIVGDRLANVHINGPSLLHTVEPKLSDAFGREVRSVRRLGKRIAIELTDELFLVIHLMIAGRFQWKKPGGKVSRRLHDLRHDQGPVGKQMAAHDSCTWHTASTLFSSGSRANAPK